MSNTKTQRRMIDGEPMKRTIHFNAQNVITSRGEWTPDGGDEAITALHVTDPEPDGQPHADETASEPGEGGMANPTDDD